MILVMPKVIRITARSAETDKRIVMIFLSFWISLSLVLVFKLLLLSIGQLYRPVPKRTIGKGTRAQRVPTCDKI